MTHFRSCFFAKISHLENMNAPPKNRPRYHLGGPTALHMCSSYCKQAPPTVNTAPPIVNSAPPTVILAPPTVKTAPPTVNWAPPSVSVYSVYGRRSQVYSRRSRVYSRRSNTKLLWTSMGPKYEEKNHPGLTK